MQHSLNLFAVKVKKNVTAMPFLHLASLSLPFAPRLYAYYSLLTKTFIKVLGLSVDDDPVDVEGFALINEGEVREFRVVGEGPRLISSPKESSEWIFGQDVYGLRHLEVFRVCFVS